MVRFLDGNQDYFHYQYMDIIQLGKYLFFNLKIIFSPKCSQITQKQLFVNSWLVF